MEISKIKIGSTVYDIKDAVSASASGSEQKSSTKLYITGAESQKSDATTYSNDKCYIGTDDCLYSNGSKVLTTVDTLPTGGGSDTKNTTGATNKADTKLYITGSSDQTANPVTYTNSNCYIGTDNCLYSGGSKAVTASNITNVIQNINSTIAKYTQVEYGISRVNGSGALSLAGTDPIYVVNVTDNISSVALQTNPTYGHSCHIIFKSANSSSHTVVIGNDSTNRICPTSAGVSLTVPASGTGYIEVDFLNVGNSSVGDEVYVRGL